MYEEERKEKLDDAKATRRLTECSLQSLEKQVRSKYLLMKENSRKDLKEKTITQEKKEEVPKEPTAKRKSPLPRKNNKEETKFPNVRLEDSCDDRNLSVLSSPFRGDGSSKKYKILSEMLQDFDRMDVEQLFRLVKERYSSSAPEGFDLMLWGDITLLVFSLMRMMRFRKTQGPANMNTIFERELHNFCGIHILLMNNGLAIHMLTEKKYPLSQEMLSKMLSTRLEVDYESSKAIRILAS
ncbi:hypothetical protein Tco_1226930 [Tanacetum coccineum]